MLKKLALTAAALAFAAPALADGWHGHPGRRAHHGYDHRPYFVPYRPVVVVPPRVVYAPPVYYYPPRVAIAAPLAPGVSISIDLPL